MRSASSPDDTKHAQPAISGVQFFLAISITLLCVLSSGCNLVPTSSAAPAQAGNTPPSSLSQITLQPSGLVLTSGQTHQFTAIVTNSSNTAVVWSANLGKISANGLFSAPVVQSKTSVVISAKCVADPSKSASIPVTVMPATSNPLKIIQSLLPAGTVGSPYSAVLEATGGTVPYRWSITAGSLPAGLTLEPGSGLISGLPAQKGTFAFTVALADANSHSISQALSISSTTSTSGNYDGPAELPRIFIQSTMADTPADGSVITVTAGGDLQAALDRASCGDTIKLHAGSTYTGTFVFPVKNCDDQHWIVVRTDAPDSVLPPEGTRLTPCYAGVSTLPGRPAFNCGSTANVVARLLGDDRNSIAPVVFASGANHYRLLGLEIARSPSVRIVYSLASSQGTMDHIVFDRLWMHGTAQSETMRGIELGGSTYISVLDSFFTDFHCVSMTGACTDSQAITGGTGDNPMGPYQIVDNFLEAAAESILFGGGHATLTPADIEVRRNHMFKPTLWKKGQPGFVGGADGNPFIVKNLFELKNAQRVLLDGNIMEYTWGGFSQSGFGLLLTPKNQAGPNGKNLCPICQVTDVTIRNTTISHVGSGLQIANGLSDNGGKPLAGERYSIHDVIIDDIDPTKYEGNGAFTLIATGTGCPLLRSVVIDHVTAFAPVTAFFVRDDVTVNGPMTGFSFTNSIVTAGMSPVWSSGGGSTNCAYHDSPLITLNACFRAYVFARNALVATSENFPPREWPVGNVFPSSIAAVQFVNFDSGRGGNYSLLSSSPFRNAGSDGKDLGADVAAVEAATAGVE